MYRFAQTDGNDFGWNWALCPINYRASIGTIVKPDGDELITAYYKPNDAFKEALIPFSAFEVEGIGKEGKSNKLRAYYRALRVVREVHDVDIDKLLGWRYSGLLRFRDSLRNIEEVSIASTQNHPLLDEWKLIMDKKKQWNSTMSGFVHYIIKDSISRLGPYLWPTVWEFIADSIAEFVSKVFDHIKGKGIFKGDPIFLGDSIRAACEACVGSLFPHNSLTPAAALWNQGLLPIFDGEQWALYSIGKHFDI